MEASSFQTAFDYFARLLPGGGIIAAALIARRQLALVRHTNAVTIAKNHYRELLEACTWNSDVIFMGSSVAGYAELRKRPVDYRRYRWLAAQMLFALQEIWIALPGDPHWERTITIVSLAFKHYLLSEIEIPPFERGGWRVDFMDFVMRSVREHEHPIVAVSADPETAGIEWRQT